MGTLCGKRAKTLVLDSSSPNGNHNPEVKVHNAPRYVQKNNSSVSDGQVLLDEGVDTKHFASPTKSSLHQFPELVERYQQVMRGDLGVNLPSKAKVVRIFTSSTFTDTATERNALMEKVYPRLKLFCQENGYEFQVVDMRWGVREEATDDHTTLELCLKELKACQEISTGPNFVTFLGQKYGYRPFPAKIPAEEFEQILLAAEKDNDQDLLRTWFECDTNSVPPAYVLQPISSRLPGYLSANEKEREEAQRAWIDVFRQIQGILRLRAKKVLQDNGVIHKYFTSVTESEIRQGVLRSSNPAMQCCWFGRNIRDLYQHTNDDHAQWFIDITSGSSTIDNEAQDLLGQLKDGIMSEKLPPSNIKTYDIEWHQNGVDPKSLSTHEQYITQMCSDFEQTMKEMIKQGIDMRTTTDVSDPLYDEALQHLAFCQSKCSKFYGREETLDQCRRTLQSKSRHPLVVHGESGSGKTSVVSMIARGSRGWLSQSTNVVIRYIGTTPDSSLVRLLLRSVCQQICVIYERNPSVIRHEMKELKEDFLNCLKFATAEQPLAVFLDSLDQFGPEDGARQLAWLPMTIPDHVTLVVSTIPGQLYECFPVLKAFLPEECFVEVPKLPEDDAALIMVNWLKAEGRALTASQSEIVGAALRKCSLPIFVRVAFDEAMRWKSYSATSETVLQVTVRGAINALFERIERQHGRKLVRKALGYITAAKSGLTETELEDLLSCDDDVLDDVYQFWTPPIRRIPPLLWVRIRDDLTSYLVDRGADGARVITWYHRQFIEAAQARYLSSKEETVSIHRAMSEYFLGVWSNGNKKPYKNKYGSHAASDRFVAPQPLLFETSSDKPAFNHRKLNELPYHMVLAQQLDQLKREVLCNFDFLLTNLRASSLRDVLDDYDLALKHKPDDADINTVKETLQLSTYALREHSAQLPSQLVGRIQSAQSPFVQQLLEQAQSCIQPCFIPSTVCLTSPGGPLVHSLSGQEKPTTALATSDDGSLVVSAAEDNTCSVWEVATGRLVRVFEDVGGEAEFIQISRDNSVFVTSCSGIICAWQMSTGQRLHTIQGHSSTAPICIVQTSGGVLLATVIEALVKFYDFETGCPKRTFEDVLPQPLNEVTSVFHLAAWDKVLLYSGRDSQVPGNWIRGVSIETGEKTAEIRTGGSLSIQSMKVTAHGTLLAAWTEGSTGRRKSSGSQASRIVLQVWNLSNATLIHELAGSSGQIRCFAMSTDRTEVMTLSHTAFNPSANLFQGNICIYDLKSFEMQRCVLHYPSSINHVVYIDYHHVISASRDKLVRVWDLERNRTDSSEAERTTEQEVVELDGRYAVFWEETGVGAVHMETGNCIRFAEGIAPQLAFINEQLVVVTSQENMYLYDIASKKMSLQFDGKTSANLLKNCFVYKNTLIAINELQTALNGYDITYGKKMFELTADQRHTIHRFVATCDGRFCAAGVKQTCADNDGDERRGHYMVWDLETNTLHQTLQLEGSTSKFDDLCLTNDGCVFLDIVYNHRIKLYQAIVYDVISGNVKHRPSTSVHVHSANISSERQYFVLGLFDGSMNLHDLETGICLKSLRAHVGSVHRVYTTSDGAVAMTTAGGLDSKDRSIKFWEAKQGGISLLTVFTPDAKISSMAISSDGHVAALELTSVVPFWLAKDGKRRLSNQASLDLLSGSFVVDLNNFNVLRKVIQKQN